MSIPNDDHQITGICVPDGTRNGKSVWKLIDEEDPHNLLTMFDRKLPEDEDITRDFYWTSSPLCEGREEGICSCPSLIPESEIIPAREGVYTIEYIGYNRILDKSIEIHCPFIIQNQFLSMVKQSHDKLKCYESGDFGVSVFYTYKGVKYTIMHCNFLSSDEEEKFTRDSPIKIVDKNFHWFSDIDMTDFKDNKINFMDIESSCWLAFNEHSKIIIQHGYYTGKADPSKVFKK